MRTDISAGRRRRPVALATVAVLAAAIAGSPPRLGAEAQQEPNRGGTLDLASQDPKVALERMQVAEGYAINLFASEKDFPELAKPMAMTFDARGRLWVLTSPTYPHQLPGVPPDDKLVILDDTNQDGKADKLTVFADKLDIPMGFELGDGGAYVSQQTLLTFLRDTNGDDKADVRKVILHGFGTEDSHHNIHAFTWDNGGGLHFQEGTFLHSQVETPYGPRRVNYAAVWRYEPRTEKLDVFVSYPFANPWGHVIDGWGQNFVSDASGGANYYGTPFSGHVRYPGKQPPMQTWVPTTVRPTGGVELVRSRHFPDNVQGNFLLTNVIGFLGIKQFKSSDAGSGFVGVEAEPLLRSNDPNFRPVAQQFGPDGALYVVDWFNPLIGHMQYSIRDPRRDAGHGRVWRITAKGRPLNERVKIEGQSIEAQLDLLKVYEDRVRYRVRRALRDRPTAEVMPAVEKWVKALDPADAGYEHHLLEALWVCQHHDVINRPLLDRLLKARDFRARAAAVRVVQVFYDRLDDGAALLKAAVADEAPRVRLEAVRALSYAGTAQAADAALEALKQPMDYYLTYALESALEALEPAWKPALGTMSTSTANPAGLSFILNRLEPKELASLPRNPAVLNALLARPGIDRADRQAALDGLAKLNGTEPLTELLQAIGRVDGVPGGAQAAQDLGAMLVSADRTALASRVPDLSKLAVDGKGDQARQAGFAALVRGSGKVADAWTLASQSPRRLVDLVNGSTMLDDQALTGELYPRVASLLAPGAAQKRLEPPPTGRYIRLVMPGRNRSLRLAEVQVFSGGDNVAIKGKAQQSNSVPGVNGGAGNAVDGKLDPSPNGGSVSFTALEHDPWWELDLGSARPIETIAIWNASGGGGGGAAGFHLTVLDEARNTVFTRDGVSSSVPSETIVLGGDLSPRLTTAAMTAVAGMKGHEAESFTLLAPYVKAGATRHAAIGALKKIPRDQWPAANLAALGDDLVAYARTVPHANRTSPAFRQVLDLGRDIASRMSGAEGQKLGATLESLVMRVIRIEAVKAQMKFDLSSFQLIAGEEVEIEFVNADEMPHNLLITTPGSLETVSLAAEAMTSDPNGFAKNFVPDTKDVLFSTPLVPPGETFRKRFTAPKPENYPFVCTFPGHWRTMNGVVNVARPPTSSAQ